MIKESGLSFSRCVDDIAEGMNMSSAGVAEVNSSTGAVVFDNKCEISAVSGENVTITRQCTKFEFEKTVFQLTVTESVSHFK